MIKQLGALTCIVTIALVCSTGVYAQTEEFIPEEVSPKGFVPNELAEAADIANLANETGLPVESVEEAIAFQHAFAEYADALLARFPDQISAVWMEPVPNTRGHIQFTQDVPPEAILEIEDIELRGGLLNPTNVVLTGGGMISMADHVRRAELAADALVDEGYQNLVTFFDPIDSVIQIEVKVPEETAQPSTLDVLDAVQNRILADRDQRGEAPLQGRAATVEASDLELTVITGPGPIFTFEHSRGGNWLLRNGNDQCTSGWSVSGWAGNGIVTAAHCTPLHQFEQPGVTPYGMNLILQHQGTEGDVAYHTTAHIELAEFFSTATNIRAVTGIQATNTMVGRRVCVYGRASNVRSCNHIVEAVGVTVNLDGVIVGSLARTDNDTSIPGDSGGGWSWGTTAWGVHSGSDDTVSYFTPVQVTQGALGVFILTQ